MDYYYKQFNKLFSIWNSVHYPQIKYDKYGIPKEQSALLLLVLCVGVISYTITSIVATTVSVVTGGI